MRGLCRGTPSKNQCPEDAGKLSDPLAALEISDEVPFNFNVRLELNSAGEVFLRLFQGVFEQVEPCRALVDEFTQEEGEIFFAG
jgi:hypothetical protein